MWEECTTRHNTGKVASSRAELLCRSCQEKQCEAILVDGTKCKNVVTVRKGKFCSECFAQDGFDCRSGRIKTTLRCGQCRVTKEKDEFVGSCDERLKWRSLGSKVYDIYRCKTCVFPSCASCATTAKKKTQCSDLKKDGTTYLWYCDGCQHTFECGQCSEVKAKTEFVGRNERNMK